MKKVLTILLITYFISLISVAHADYVLPYPSYMPGNTLYRISRIVDKLKNYWSFGNIAQFKYHLELSDKYLVEAQTLLEYNQYLLGADALTRSDAQFQVLPMYLQGAKNEGVDISNLKQTAMDAAAKHESVLSALLITSPATFNWQPEKTSATELHLGTMIQSSIELRARVASISATL